MTKYGNNVVTRSQNERNLNRFDRNTNMWKVLSKSRKKGG